MPKYQVIAGKHRRQEEKDGVKEMVTYERGDIVEMDEEEAGKFVNKFRPVSVKAVEEEETPAVVDEVPAQPKPAQQPQGQRPAIQPKK